MSESNQTDSDREPLTQSDRFSSFIVLVAAIYIVLAVFNGRPLQSANDRSRWCTIWSLVERGTYHIDEIDRVSEWSTIDKVRHRQTDDDPYHFYSSKPPLFPTMVAGLYWLEKQTIGYDLKQDTAQATRLILFFVNAVPMILALICFKQSLLLLSVSHRARWLLLSAAGFASMLNPYLTTLNNHTPAAACLVFSLAAIIRLHTLSPPRSRDFAMVGVTAALTCCFELPAALFGLLSFFVVVRLSVMQTLKWYVPAALLPLAAFFITNWICTGGIRPFYTYYGTEKYVYVHEGVPSYWSEPKGIDANDESTPVYLFHCTFGHHGIFSLSPVFVLTIGGWLIGFRSDRFRSLRTVLLLGVGVSVVVLIFYLTRTQNYNYGGNSCALRWMLWLTPFWWYGMIPAIQQLARFRAGIAVVVALIAASFYSSFTSLRDPWKPNWLFVEMERRGLIDYRTPIPPFDPPRFTVIERIPPPGVTNSFRGTGDATGTRLELSTLEAEDATADRHQLVIREQRVATSGKLETIREATVIVAANLMKQGSDVAEWLLLPETANGKGVPNWVIERLRGLPSPRPYNAASPRYFRYTNGAGEKTAVRCDRGASRVAFEHPEFGRCWQRCDVYYSDATAFGVAQWKITITQDETNKGVASETWTCLDLP